MQQWKYKLLLCIALLAQVAGAVPTLPMVVSGSVHINDAPAPEGTVIKAMLGGEVKGSTVLLQPGNYGMIVEYGKGLVEFYVNDEKAQSIDWSNEPTILNLTVMIVQPNQTAQATQTAQIAASTAQSGGGQSQTSGTTAAATSAVLPKVTPASPKVTPGIAISTDTISQHKNETQQMDLQKQEAVKSPDFEAAAVAFIVLLTSKLITGRKK